MTQRRGYRSSDDDLEVLHRHQPAPGKTARTDDLPVQRKDSGSTSDADVQARAAEGVQGNGGQLPFMDVIQRSFGRHDIGSTRAHTDDNAQAASEAIGARAYAVGNDVAFAGTPDLHTAAHEAAHVVQQRAGVHLKGGVGQAGDAYEHHADAVADLVVQGKSAEDLLDTMSGHSGASDMAVQKDEAEEDTRPKKKVGKASKARLDAAQKAISYTKKVMAQGAGNQWEAIKATNANSTFRMQVMRDENNEYWDVDPELWDVISANPAAFTAAKAELMDGGGGGNCGEHADLAFDFLCATTSGDEVAVSQQKGFDHAFVIIGAMSEEDEQLVVSDPWPTRPVAVMWTDHFAFCDRKILLRHQVGTASGKSAKDVIKKGLRLTPVGRATMQAKLSDKETDKLLKDGRQGDHPWIWNHPTTPARGADYNYVE